MDRGFGDDSLFIFACSARSLGAKKKRNKYRTFWKQKRPRTLLSRIRSLNVRGVALEQGHLSADWTAIKAEMYKHSENHLIYFAKLRFVKSAALDTLFSSLDSSLVENNDFEEIQTNLLSKTKIYEIQDYGDTSLFWLSQYKRDLSPKWTWPRAINKSPNQIWT